MNTVTSRIRHLSQPRGGYLHPKSFKEVSYDDGKTLRPMNVNPSLLGTTVDALIRLSLGEDINKALDKALPALQHMPNALALGRSLLKKDNTLQSLSDSAIVKVFRLCDLFQYSFIPVTPSPSSLMTARDLRVDGDAVWNTRVLLERGLTWLESRPPVEFGFTFEGGYTNIINKGDGDVLTQDGLWDFKTSKTAPTSKNTVQVAIYWRMGLHSVSPEKFDVQKLGFFNPLLNKSWEIEVSDIDPDVVKAIDEDVIGYGGEENETRLLREQLRLALKRHRTHEVREMAKADGVLGTVSGAWHDSR